MSENTLCTHCGVSNASSKPFCSECGASLAEVNHQPNHTQKPVIPIQSTSVAPSTDETLQEQKRNVLGILGLIFGILNLFVFSWFCAFAWIWMSYVFFVFCVLGIVFVALSLRNNKAIGITGLIFNILATIIQTCLVIFATSLFISA